MGRTISIKSAGKVCFFFPFFLALSTFLTRSAAAAVAITSKCSITKVFRGKISLSCRSEFCRLAPSFTVSARQISGDKFHCWSFECSIQDCPDIFLFDIGHAWVRLDLGPLHLTWHAGRPHWRFLTSCVWMLQFLGRLQCAGPRCHSWKFFPAFSFFFHPAVETNVACSLSSSFTSMCMSQRGVQ